VCYAQNQTVARDLGFRFRAEEEGSSFQVGPLRFLSTPNQPHARA